MRGHLKQVGDNKWRLVVYAAFVLIFAFFAVTLSDDGFLSQTNLLNIVRQTTPITVMAVATVFPEQRLQGIDPV